MAHGEFSIEEFVSFLLRARQHGYAGSAEKLEKPQRPGFKEFPPYVEGGLEYTDSYAGYYFAPGQEVVRWRGIPVWAMAYSGGMLPKYYGNLVFTKNVYSFLKKALLRVEPERPFRGPRKFEEDKFMYLDESEGDISNFSGTEKILHATLARTEEVYRQKYIGGFIIHIGGLASPKEADESL